MSIKINGTIVFESNADGTPHLLNVASIDANTEVAFVDAVKADNHFFILETSAGTTKGTFYGANTA